MARLYDPVQLTHPQLHEFAVVAAWIATVAEAASDLEDLLVDLPPRSGSCPISVPPDHRKSIRSGSPSPSSGTTGRSPRRGWRGWPSG